MNKLIKKATTWFLVFGMTFTPAFTGINLVAANAEEGGEPTITIKDAQNNVDTAQVLADKATPANAEPSAQNTGAEQLIDNAQNDLNLIQTGDADQNTEGLKSDLQSAATSIANTESNLSEAEKALNEAAAADAEATTAIETAANAIVSYVQATDENGNPVFNEDGSPAYEVEKDENGEPKVDENGLPVYKVVVTVLPTFDDTAKKTEDDANTAIKKAENAQNESQAKAAKSALKDAEDGLAQAEQEVADAQEAVDAAVANVAKAQDKVDEANKKVEAAQAALNKALKKNANGGYSGNVEDAEKALKKAVEDAQALKDAADEAVTNAQYKNLELIREKLNAVKGYIDEHPEWTTTSYPEEYMLLARDLCKAVLMNRILEDREIDQYGLDFQSVQFVTGFKPVTDADGKQVPTKRQKKDENGNPLVDDNGNPVYECDENGNELFYYEYETEMGSVYEEAKWGIGEDPRGWIVKNGLTLDSKGNEINGGCNRVVVTYKVTGKDGKVETVTKYYNYKANDKDGSIYIFERKYEIKEGDVFLEATTPVSKKVVEQEAQDAVEESWKTAEGKVFEEKETTITVPVENAENGEFYAIDTESEPLAEETYTFEELTPAEQQGSVDYKYETMPVWDGTYEKIPGIGADGKSIGEKVTKKEAKEQIEKYTNLGFVVRLTYHEQGNGNDKKEICSDDPGFWELVEKIVGNGKRPNQIKIYTTTAFVEDKTQKHMVDQSGVVEVKTAWFTETSTDTENTGKKSTQAEALNEANARKAELEKLGYTVTLELKTEGKNKKKTYYYEIKVEKTEQVEKIVSKKLYPTDKFVTHVEGQEAKEEISHSEPVEVGNDKLVKEKLVWSADKKGAFEGQDVINAEDYLNALALLQKKEELDLAVIDARAALERVQKLKAELQKSRNIQLASIAALELWNANLKKAEDELDQANKKVDELEDLVEKARKKVRNIRFPGGEDEDTTSGTPTGTTPAGPAPAADTTATYEIFPVGGTTGGTTSGVAGVRVEAIAGEGDANGEAEGDGVEAVKLVAENPVIMEDDELPAAEVAKTSNIEEDELPAAANVEEEGFRIWWLWILIVLAVLTGYGIYKYQDNKKKKAENIEK